MTHHNLQKMLLDYFLNLLRRLFGVEDDAKDKLPRHRN